MNSFFERRYVIQGIFILLTLCLLGKIFYIQIIDDQYLLSANNNVIRRVIMFPGRGPILDRNNNILVQNEPMYDIMVTPKEVTPFDTVKLCELLGIDRDGFDKRWKKAVAYSRTLPSPFEKQLPLKLYQSFQEHLYYEFHGFSVQPRTVRTYPDSVAAQFLGYIGEVTDNDIAKSHGYYHRGDYIGRTGVEKAYEELLRGQRGVQNQLVDSRGVKKGEYLNGMYDTVAVSGKRLISSLDLRIQKLGEKLMQNKVGSIVAIEPSTGEILAFVSSPTYDPNLMVGRERGRNASLLYQNPYDPFLIRPIQAYYSPGSSFKPLNALIGLQEGIITPQTTFFCAGTYWAGNHAVACTHHHGVTNLTLGIAGSCNVYFDNVFNKLMNMNGPKNTEATYVGWKDRINKFGFGVKLNIDMPNERKGYVPSAEHYNKVYHGRHWNANTIISLGIGQGELLATPMQMANIECIIANHGYYYKPHLIKGIGDQNITKPEFTVKNDVGVDGQYFEPVIDGMQEVVQSGTAAASRIPGIVMCGKTGTVQNSHGKNHSVFVAFAPRDNPKIAIAVVVENSGQGAEWAAPIASYIVEKYLKDSTTTRPSGKTIAWLAGQNLLPELKAPTPPGIFLPGKGDSSVKPSDTIHKRIIDTAKSRLKLKSASHLVERKKKQLLAFAYKERKYE
jgi:penicillin-binding protein 2